MSTTYIDVLPPTNSSPHRAIRYTPACGGVGTLEVQDKRSSTRYVVRCLPFGGVRFAKADGENYVAVAGACECRGFIFGGGKLCKHLEALHCLYANGWLDDRETTGDRYEDADERAEWFDDNSPDRMGDDEYADALGRRIVCELGGC